MKPFFKNNADNILLICILIIAFILRAYRLSSIPFMHDEFSALLRTQYNSFNELIEKGVMIDGHPPLIQVFLFYWVKIFGFSEAWLKLPFIVSGVVAVYLAYKIATDWFGKTPAVAIASLLAYLQYPIFYSQIIRPYSSGLFLILLFVYFWNKVIFYSDKKRYFNLIGFVISGSLCTYNHHFTLLQVAIIVITGIFYVKRKDLFFYLGAGVAIFLLYLPNISIFKAQLEMKGIGGWLGKPENDFILEYLYYIVNYSLITAVSVFLIFVAGFFIKPFFIIQRKSLIWVSLAWFVIPFLTGFFYSKYINAVLQYSVLIFAFPFLLFGIFGWMKSNNFKFRIITAIILAFVCISTLIFERKHYKIFYNSPYEQIVKEAVFESDSLISNNCLVVFSMAIHDTANTSSKIFNYYADKYKKINVINIYDADKPEDFKPLQKMLTNYKGNYIYYGYLAGASCEAYPLIQHYFPYICKTMNYYGGNAVIFSKKTTSSGNDYIYNSENSFEGKVSNWSDYNVAFLIDSITSNGKFSYRFDSLSEWGPCFSDTLLQIANKSVNYIDISVDVMPLGNFTNAQLVSSIEQDKLNLLWSSSQFKNFLMISGKWNTVVHSIKLPDINLKNTNPLLNVYIWNCEKQNFLIDNFKVRVRKGNPILYWIVNKEVENQ